MSNFAKNPNPYNETTSTGVLFNAGSLWISNGESVFFMCSCLVAQLTCIHAWALGTHLLTLVQTHTTTNFLYAQLVIPHCRISFSLIYVLLLAFPNLWTSLPGISGLLDWLAQTGHLFAFHNSWFAVVKSHLTWVEGHFLCFSIKTFWFLHGTV